MNVSVLIKKLENLRDENGPNTTVEIAESPHSVIKISDCYFEPTTNSIIVH